MKLFDEFPEHTHPHPPRLIPPVVKLVALVLLAVLCVWAATR